jgi:hypothetical protein
MSMDRSINPAVPNDQRSGVQPIRYLLTGFVILAFLAATAYVAAWGTVRPMSRREACTFGVRPLAQALGQYADNNDGRLPEDLAELLFYQYTDGWALVCPRSDDRPAVGATNVAQAMALYRTSKAGHCSYVYLGQGVNRHGNPDAAILYEPGKAGDEELLVLRADGTIAWLARADRRAFLDRVAGGERPVRVPLDR